MNCSSLNNAHLMRLLGVSDFELVPEGEVLNVKMLALFRAGLSTGAAQTVALRAWSDGSAVLPPQWAAQELVSTSDSWYHKK